LWKRGAEEVLVKNDGPRPTYDLSMRGRKGMKTFWQKKNAKKGVS